MDKQYEQYCLADPLFYDSLPQRDPQTFFPAARRPLPGGWRQAVFGDWLVNFPPGPPLPAQGWKIHVSACPGNAEETITRVWEYCVPRGIAFKFMCSPLAVLLRNAKYAPRSGSGKAVTVYPADESACARILGELDAELQEAPGPYILSDLRYGSGPLYVRYGGFTERLCLDSHGEMVPAIENPAGDLVPDVRSPVFTLPDWVSLPDFLAPHLAARNKVSLTGLDYEVTGALHFSNGGGVYTATDKATGERVILKEGRPHAGLAADGSDAVARLRRESDVLTRLSGLGIAPEPRGYFQAGEHHFLAEEFIPGRTLNSFFAERYPLAGPAPDPAATKAYTAWSLAICEAVERAAEAMHARGVVFNDLHLFNIMVRPDDSVAFIDFEAASDIDEGRVRTVASPGFAAPRDRTGFDVDAYSLACIRLAMFMPLTSLFALDADKAAHFAAVIEEHFPVPREYLDEAVQQIIRGVPADRKGAAMADQGPAMASAAQRQPAASPERTGASGRAEPAGSRENPAGSWEEQAAGLVTAIQASATPDREDRLFPGDIDQFRVPGGGLGLAHGAAGVLYALSEAAGVRVPEWEEWLLARTAEPAQGSRLGLYDGLAGIAFTLGRLGHADAAARLAGICLGERWERLGHSLYAGLPGIALSMLGLADQVPDTALIDAAMRAAEMVAQSPASPAGRGGAVGLLRGASGTALLFIRLYERTGDPGYLDTAQAAIAADLDRCVPDRKGALQVDEGWRTLPYLGGGSVGIGMVIDQFLAHRQHARFTQAAGLIRLAASSVFYAQAGLFNGRAGMIAYLAGRDRNDPGARAQLSRLPWHAVRYGHGLAYPGEMLMRLSMDLGTGTAGVLLGMAAALAPHRTALPFLAQPPSLPDSVPGHAQAILQGATETHALTKEVKVNGSSGHAGDGAHA